MARPFSLEEIKSIPPFTLTQPSYIAASDEVPLAYYPFIPAHPKAIVIFYHGGGLYSNATYQWLAQQLQSHTVGCYLFDIRGHGYSGGPRGDAPSSEQVWHDIDVALAFVRSKHENIPVYLAGHSSGAGLLINYNAYNPTNSAAGYIFIAPYLGPHSGTIKENPAPYDSFVKKVRTWLYIANNIMSWQRLRHIPAVYFNYSPRLLAKDPLIVSSYTFTMSCATTPYKADDLFGKINKPCALYIGTEDEQFIAEKIVDYQKHLPTDVQPQCTMQLIPGAKHLSMLLDAPGLIAQYVRTMTA